MPFLPPLLTVGMLCCSLAGAAEQQRSRATLFWKTMTRRTISILAVACALSACASSSKDVAATYISPLQFQSYDCDQLAAETQRIQARVTQIGGRLDEASTNDKIITGAGAVLFWPALFFLGGTKQQEADFARLKGEYEAVQQAAIQKRCGGLVHPPTNPPAATASAASSPA